MCPQGSTAAIVKAHTLLLFLRVGFHLKGLNELTFIATKNQSVNLLSGTVIPQAEVKLDVC